MSYTFFSDSGHGWLKVSAWKLIDLDLLSKITRYSYMSPSGRWVYLEEDCDLTTYLVALGKNHAGWDAGLGVKVKHSERSSIRGYPRIDRDYVLYQASKSLDRVEAKIDAQDQQRIADEVDAEMEQEKSRQEQLLLDAWYMFDPS